MKRLVIALMSVLLCAGCLAPLNNGGGNNGGGNNGGPSGWVGVCKVRPVIVTSGGKTQWDSARVQRYVRWLDPGFRNASLTFTILRAEKVEKPEWFVIDKKSEFYAMSEESMKRSKEKGEMIVWFVDSIPVWSAGGIAQRPSNAAGKYQHGLAMSVSSSEAALVHEMGHAFNLQHAWSDDFTDTPTKDSGDCSLEPCNAMTYCGDRRLPRGSCLGRTFSRQQVSEMQKWASAYPRNEVVSARNVPPGVVVTYTGNIEPETD